MTKTILARLTLAAFAATLPGSAAWAQTVARVVPAAVSAAGVSGAVAVPLRAPALSVSAPSALPMPDAAPLSAVTLPALPIPTPMPSAVPLSAGSARASDAAVSVQDSLKNASRDMAPLPSPGGGSRHFDGAGSRGGASGDGSNALAKRTGLVPAPAPAQAPVLAMTRAFFPGVRKIRLAVDTSDAVAVVGAALRGGYMIAATVGRGTDQGHNTMGTLMRVSLPSTEDGKFTVVMEPIRPVKITGYAKEEGGIPAAKVSYPDTTASSPERLKELSSVAVHILDQFASLDPEIDADVVRDALAETNAHRLTNLLAQELPFSDEVKQRLLASPSIESRLQTVVLEMMGHFKEKSAKASDQAEEGKKGNIDTPEGLKAKMQAIGMPEAIREIARKEFDKLSKMNPKDPEAQKLRGYIEWLTDVPWGQRTEDNFDIARAKAILDRDHAGLEKVKERVLEFLALRKKTGSKKGAILAFTGPPGVGKTSIAGAIAQALGRRFVRLSMGGVHDETALRGHGRTYLGSMPGEIMRQMKAAGVVNPLMLLDEVDKIGRNGNQGDPTAALLEILDPAQNNTFRDRYLDVPYDLSEVLFVVTSNELSNIPEPLRDRMEIIEFDGYTTLEKLAIAEKHIIPQKLDVTGLKPAEASLTKGAIRRIIEGYTMEAGVRSLREKIEAVLRKISAWTETRGEKAPGLVDEDAVEKYLGVPRFSPRETAQNGVGVATGLAVNAYGGSTLNVEVSREPGSGQLKLRKQFGDDIEDSAKNAYKYVKQHAAALGLADFDFTKIDLDINITPAGKVDGPSAGGLMVTAIVSALTGRPVRAGLAMTGEITMRGDILPIGGLKQKVMAAHRMGYTMVIFPFANLKDIEDIPAEVRNGITLKAVKNYGEIFPEALEPAAP
ncbi:MAG: endopeptidase La [Elusimicrobia bacterium RBG_16_66_12]|nr:MAG: endopeptidase La [Elusimicrobia bacterium RBG_16_66_12]